MIKTNHHLTAQHRYISCWSFTLFIILLFSETCEQHMHIQHTYNQCPNALRTKKTRPHRREAGPPGLETPLLKKNVQKEEKNSFIWGSLLGAWGVWGCKLIKGPMVENGESFKMQGKGGNAHGWGRRPHNKGGGLGSGCHLKGNPVEGKEAYLATLSPPYYKPSLDFPKVGGRSPPPPCDALDQ